MRLSNTSKNIGKPRLYASNRANTQKKSFLWVIYTNVYGSTSIVSLKVDLKYLKNDLQFRLDGNDIEGTKSKYKDDVNGFAKRAGVFEAYATMDNDTFKRAIKSIENMEKDLELR